MEPGDRKGLLYVATLFVNTWKGAVRLLTHASVHASCSPSPEVFSTSLFAIAIIARDGRLCDSGALGSGRLSFGLKYIPGQGHGQKKLHYVFTFILCTSLCQINSCRNYFAILTFVGPRPYENILTTNISRITVYAMRAWPVVHKINI